MVSNSVWPHRWQPTRLRRPWDSPGKNTGVGCHFLLQCLKVKSEREVAQSCTTLSDPMDCSLPAYLRSWDFPGRSTGVRGHCLLQDPSSQSYSFSSSCVWMWELDQKKAEHQRIDAFEMWCWRRLLRVPWTARRLNQTILMEINPEYSLERLMLKLKL